MPLLVAPADGVAPGSTDVLATSSSALVVGVLVLSVVVMSAAVTRSLSMLGARRRACALIRYARDAQHAAVSGGAELSLDAGAGRGAGAVADLVVNPGRGFGARAGAGGGSRGQPLPSRAAEKGIAAGGQNDDLDVELVAVLLAAALRSGVSVSRALAVVSQQLPASQAESLGRAATALEWGAGWRAATAHVPPPMSEMLTALAPAWDSGASPDGALRLWAEQHRRRRHGRAREAAGRLAVHLVLPLGLCSLPAFVLLGLVPLVFSFGFADR